MGSYFTCCNEVNSREGSETLGRCLLHRELVSVAMRSIPARGLKLCSRRLLRSRPEVAMRSIPARGLKHTMSFTLNPGT